MALLACCPVPGTHGANLLCIDAGMPAGIGSGAHGLLSIVFHRKHCVPDPNWQTREGGKRWSTIKPLAVHGLELTRTLLIDNEAYKAAAGERFAILQLCCC